MEAHVAWLPYKPYMGKVGVYWANFNEQTQKIYGNGENALLSVDVLNKKNQKKRQLYSLKNGFFVSPKVDSFSLLRKELSFIPSWNMITGKSKVHIQT